MEQLSRLTDFLKKNKYVLLVVLLGVALMLIPGSGEEQEAEPVAVQTEVETDLSQELASILSKIHGAGKVEVMLTVAAGEEVIYQTNGQTGTDTARMDTVTVTDENRKEQGLVRQVIPETFLGAIVVCQGADDPTVRLAIVEAVSKVTGLGTDRISVWKMK